MPIDTTKDLEDPDFDERRSNEDLVKQGLILLASIDEAEPYEVDENHIFYDPTANGSLEFLLRSGSGCSCWEGDYTHTWYDSLDELEEILLSNKGPKSFSPTLKGAQQLLKEARESFAKIV